MKDNNFYLLIVGSRSSAFTTNRYRKKFNDCVDKILKNQIKQNKNIIIVHGGCQTGGDKLADIYAKENKYKLKIFPADWNKYGKGAGYIRNKEMHKYISQFTDRGVFAWWDGKSKGTAHSFELAKEFDNPIRIFNPLTFKWINND